MVEDSLKLMESPMKIDNIENTERDSKVSPSNDNSQSEMIDLTNNAISSCAKNNVNNNHADPIVLDSSEEKNDDNSGQSPFPYVPLPGNKDTVMVDFSKKSSTGYSKEMTTNKDKFDVLKITYEAGKSTISVILDVPANRSTPKQAFTEDNLNSQSTSKNALPNNNETFIVNQSKAQELIMGVSEKEVMYQKRYEGCGFSEVLRDALGLSQRRKQVSD